MLIFALRRAVLLFCCCAIPDLAARAQAAEAADPPRQMDTVEVVAQVSGPGLWEVRHGDHVLWILGTQSPLPRRFEWSSDEVDARLAESSLLIAPPAVTFNADVGRLRGLMLLPSLLRARRDPEERSLQEVVGPELYARWQPLKQRYLGRSRKVERWRPLFAAMELWQEAIEDAGMTGSGPVWRAVSKAAKKLDLQIEKPLVTVEIVDTKATIRDFARSPLNDLDCFSGTLERLETDIDAMRERAEAWAVGDLEGLRALPFKDQNAACQDAFLSASLGERNTIEDLPERVRAAWLEQAERALEEHRSSVAVLSIASLLDPDSGLLEALRARGYAVREPGQSDAPASTDAEPMDEEATASAHIGRSADNRTPH
jgi:hypothetical protein